MGIYPPTPACWASFGSGSWTITLVQQPRPHPTVPTPQVQVTLSLPLLHFGRKVTTPPAVRPWGLHHPSLVTLTFPSLGLVGQGVGGDLFVKLSCSIL